jgi:limonene-1,2-epoxide hydrolase
MTELLDRVRDLLTDLGRDPESALATIPELYAEEMTFRDPIQEVHGRDAFVEVTRRLIDRSRVLEVSVHHAARSEDAMFISWTMVVAFRSSPRITFDGISQFDVSAGRIVLHREVFDLAGSVLDALPGVRRLYRTAVRRLG